MATLGKQEKEINIESIINKWGSMEECWNNLVVGASEEDEIDQSSLVTVGSQYQWLNILNP